MKKKSESYRMMNATMHINRVIIRNVNMSSNVNEFAEEFDDMIVISLIDLLSDYDQIALNERDRDMTAIQTLLRLLRQTTVLQETINSMTQFVRITKKILRDIISEKKRVFLDDIEIKDSRDDYDNKKAMLDVRKYVLKHLQNLDKTLYLLKLSDAVISTSKSQFLKKEIRIVK